MANDGIASLDVPAQQQTPHLRRALGRWDLVLLFVVAVFNLGLARTLALPLGGLSVVGFVLCAMQYWLVKAAPGKTQASALRQAAANPLELGSAALFAALFVAVSLVSNWAKAKFGVSGIYTLAAIVGVTDIDPFVLNLAQGGVAGMDNAATAAAIMIAASSNNVLKAGYAVGFAGSRATAASVAALVALALAGLAAAYVLMMHA